ncbi:hypothetical protein RUA4292_01709 [Ruegeria atlantica]|uniref:Uncharacterized protein n=1 Tax=Ruegeria atlantica TaxID=81569 RepID=A0A0P1EYC6_9RHOB|nr:hypothetical protein RUA4292_01709 [Ruegeria atlantica]
MFVRPRKRPGLVRILLFQIAMNTASQSFGLQSGTCLQKSPFTDAERGIISKKVKAFALKLGNQRWNVNGNGGAVEILC